jgi:prephenate dehydratase
MMKIAYLGPSGTFSEEAAALYRGEARSAELVPVAPLYDLILAVDSGEYEEGIVPIENSLEGSISITLDMLVKEVKLFIKKEIILAIRHYLLARPGTKLKDVTDIVSHGPATGQCHKFLHERMRGARVHPAESTAKAAEIVAGQKETPGQVWAAIGSMKAAGIYGLEMLTDVISDYQDNYTRFVVLAKKDDKPTGQDKTSIVFSSLRDKPGALFEILGEFANRQINLSKIESRPSKKMLGDYLFFVDLAGHREDQPVKDALASIEKNVSFFKMLGSYPKYDFSQV